MSAPSLGGGHHKAKPSATIVHYGENMSWKDFDFLDKLGEGYCCFLAFLDDGLFYSSSSMLYLSYS